MSSNHYKYPLLYNRKVIEYVTGFCIAFSGSFFLTGGDQFILLISIGFSTLIAYHFPLVLIIIHFLIFILPAVLMKFFDNTRTWKIKFNELNIDDILLVIMVAAILIRLGIATISILRRHRVKSIDFKLWIPFTAFCLWLLYEIYRNFDTYGLSAAGEFRSHYLILALPVYIALFFDTPQKRKTLFKTALLFCFVIPILCIPFIGGVKGWAIGPKNRFFPADVSFGIFQGLFFCFLSNRSGYTKIPKFIQWAVSLAAILILILDTHRSVWFSGIIMGVVFIGIDKNNLIPSFNKALRYAFIGIIVVFLSSSATTLTLDKNLLEFITERSQDLYVIEDNSDSTWVWRIERWEMEMDKIVDSPLTGLGFGGYWGEEHFLRTDGVSPHNLYVQILVKL
ncbi:MAG: O-antigen ligase family protein, partial [Desulfobacterales bacterium]|nr:O-antigen ligase family protein [Desulfobacterales bacterium]